jgi:hypothetical protein
VIDVPAEFEFSDKPIDSPEAPPPAAPGKRRRSSAAATSSPSSRPATKDEGGAPKGQAIMETMRELRDKAGDVEDELDAPSAPAAPAMAATSAERDLIGRVALQAWIKRGGNPMTLVTDAEKLVRALRLKSYLPR